MAKHRILVPEQVTEKNRFRFNLAKEDVGKWAFYMRGGGTFVTDSYTEAVSTANSMR